MNRFSDLSIAESIIVRKLIQSILAVKGGLRIRIEADGEEVIAPTRSEAAIERAYDQHVFDVAQWIVTNKNGLGIGSLMLVHGNDEHVISDYTPNLEWIVAPINDFIDGKAA